MKKALLFLSIFNISIAFAQVPEDAVRYSWYIPNGSARNMAIGGAMGSLGGEITSVFVNPAGLAFYRNSEVVFSPAFIINKNIAAYRDSNSLTKKNALNWGPTGIIIGIPNNNDEHKNSAIAIAFNQRTSFNNIINYSGLNNYSSYSEQFAEEFAKSNLSIETVLNSNSPIPYTVAPALYTYLIDTVRVNGELQIKAAPEYLLDSGKSIMQQMNKTTKGGIYEWAFSFATKINEKWLFGGTMGIPIINYQSNTRFTESDVSGDTSNRFSSFTYTDNFTTYGSGINLKMGAIFRPKEYIRIGVAFHTPDLMVLKDTRTTTLTNNLENPISSYSASSLTFTNNETGQAKYQMNTAWKAMLSASYVFREIENVKRQKGFITADIEYVKHKGSRFKSNNESPTSDEEAYYQSLGKVIKDNYKGAFNFRVGGELKFNVIMARLGFAYYGNPYVDHAFKASQMLLSGGLGYRNNGFFIDLTYAYHITRNVDLPYRLEDRANTFANLKQNQQNILVTIGIKF
jgi:hypothetical protein